MIAFFANIFGYILNFIYGIFQNYGIAIILFTILLKLLLLPLTIKQQKTMRKTSKIQEKLKIIQFKYKNDPQMLNQETMALYKSENMSPFSGCLSAIVQILLLLAMFYLVSSPLTYMKKVDTNVINTYKEELQLEEKAVATAYPEINIIKEKGSTDEAVNINMDFLGLDLSNVPSQSLTDPTVYVIPLLYVISSVFSIKLSMNMTKKNKKDKALEKIDDKENKENTELDAMESMNKNMMIMMPVMSVIISFIAPLGLALYWLVNNVLMILERVVITKILDKKEEANENA